MSQSLRNGSLPGTQAVQRAASLLKAFAAPSAEGGRQELRLPELAEMAGLNKTTAYRLLTALTEEGLLQRLPDGHGYRLGPELLALGSRAVGASGLREAAHTELQALAFSTRETATIELLVGRDVLILDEAVGDYVVGSMPSLGTRWPAHATSTGKVLLAHVAAPLLDQLLGSKLPPATSRTITDPAALRRELARVRERGFALNAEELEPGFLAIAAPVRAAGGAVVAAVSVGGPKARLNQERVKAIVALLPRVAARISARLGFTGDGEARARGRRVKQGVEPPRRATARRAAARRAP